jgi:hypothetical protein
MEEGKSNSIRMRVKDLMYTIHNRLREPRNFLYQILWLRSKGLPIIHYLGHSPDTQVHHNDHGFGMNAQVSY